jgi:hypothetical protein
LMEFTALDRAAAIGHTYTLEKLVEWRETPLFGTQHPAPARPARS